MSCPASQQASCLNCYFAALCPPIAKKTFKLQRNQLLCKPHDRFQQFYVVRTGVLKAYEIDVNGKERITAFYLPGEIFGLEAIHSGTHVFSVAAITETTVCEVSYLELLQLLAHYPKLQERFLTIMSQRMSLGAYMTQTDAEQRLLGFLQELAARLHLDGSNSKFSEFTLPMSRQDIGNYLGLAAETITRLFNRLQEAKLLSLSSPRHLKMYKA